ncbi:MAG: lipoate-protein ligase, partial [Myxococcales bacterium]|nr:lipoate-protein ligase [Myxococcales bacterium]
RTVARFGIAGERKQGWTGAWTAGGSRKLASIGVAVKRWVTLHGFALNVSTELSRFAAINPCGLEATIMGSLQSVLDRPVAVSDVKSVATAEMGAVFGRVFTSAAA